MASETSESKHDIAKTPRSDPLPSSSAKPPVTIHPTTHLDPGAYVRGTHPLNISSNNLIHPRSYLLVTHAPLNIGSNTVIYPKATIGAPQPQTPLPSNIDTSPATSQTPSTLQPTTIGSHVQVHPHATVHISATICDYAILESHVTIHPNVTIGAHSKVCAGITIPPNTSIPEWTVIYGNGQMRRLRKNLAETQPNTPPYNQAQPPSSLPRAATTTKDNEAIAASLASLESKPPDIKNVVDPTIAETHRITAQNQEREATATLLRNNARMQVMARQKAAKAGGL